MTHKESESPRAVPKDEVKPKRRSVFGALATGADAFEFIIYGGVAAILVGWGLWELAQVIWRQGSAPERAIFVGLFAAAVAIVLNDIRRRRFSLLSGILAALWGIALILIILSEVFSRG